MHRASYYLYALCTGKSAQRPSLSTAIRVQAITEIDFLSCDSMEPNAKQICLEMFSSR